MSSPLTLNTKLIVVSEKLEAIKAELNNKDPEFIKAWLRISHPEFTESDWLFNLLVENLSK